MKELEIVLADTPELIAGVQSLLREYGRSRLGDPALAGYEEEVAGLPGKYGPPKGALLVAVGADGPVGCVAYRSLGDGICEMKRLYVTPFSRGKGLGRKLVREIVGKAAASGYRLMRLDSIPSMQAAQQLYEQEGFFEIAGYWQNPNPGTKYYEIDLAAGSAPE